MRGHEHPTWDDLRSALEAARQARERAESATVMASLLREELRAGRSEAARLRLEARHAREQLRKTAGRHAH